jgi:hypothetical protein
MKLHPSTQSRVLVLEEYATRSLGLIVAGGVLQDQRKDFLTFVAGQGLHVGFVHPK